jgi:hypothetical protein
MADQSVTNDELAGGAPAQTGAQRAMANFLSAPTAIGDFFSSTAKNTKDSIHGLRQKIEYAAKQHSLAEDFKHDEEVAMDVAVGSN